MNDDAMPAAGQNADLLARAYIDALASAENVKTKSMLNALLPQDPILHLLGEAGDTHDADGPHLRVDLVMATVLTAKAVAAEPGLAMRLRREAPILTIETHTADMVPLVLTALEDCAASGNKGRHIVARDGSERGHAPDRGNAEIIASLNRRKLTAGIAADVKRYLPISLQRTAEYRLSIPAIDDWAIRLTIEACTGSPMAEPIDPGLVRAADLGDLTLAIRSGLSAEECLRRLERVVTEKASHSGDGPELSELHGYGEAMVWAKDLVTDLQEYKQGRIEWDAVDNSALLLAGPPGVGKTSFVAAVAKTARVPLVATSVAQWNSATYLSGTLQAIRDAFGQARRSAPCVMLIDEADGISDRSKIYGEHTEYWLQVVNTLLENMSGIADNEGVVIIATTNHPEKIDPAVRRAGRLDRLICLEKPRSEDLAKIFRQYLTADLLSGVDLMPVALAAAGQTGADVETYVRRAKATARRAHRELQLSDLLDQVRQGRPDMTPEARHRVAIHESGHAIVGRTLGTGRLLGVSMDETGGMAEFADMVDLSMAASKVDDFICVMLAGRAAEAMVLGDVAIGSALDDNSDLGRATRLAEMLETKGAGKLRNLYLPSDLASNLLQIPGMMAAVKGRLDEAEARAAEILKANRKFLDAIANELKEHAYLSADDVERIAATYETMEAAE